MEEILEEISQKDFKKEKFVKLVLNDEKIRDFIVEQMINHPKIMKYYHCFYIIQEACELEPQLFYPFWDRFEELLNHPNSYHRDFGLILIGILVSIDNENRIYKIIDEYLFHLYDNKFMTSEACVRNSFKIAKFKPTLEDRIVQEMMDYEKKSIYSEKQTALMISHIIEGFELIFNTYHDKSKLMEFSKYHLNSISPKTRKTAKDFIKNHII